MEGYLGEVFFGTPERAWRHMPQKEKQIKQK